MAYLMQLFKGTDSDSSRQAEQSTGKAREPRAVLFRAANGRCKRPPARARHAREDPQWFFSP